MPKNEEQWVSLEQASAKEKRQSSYHGLDIRMRHGVELLVHEFIVGPNVNVSALVLG